MIQSLVGGGVGSVLFATLKDTLILVDVSFVLLSQSSESPNEGEGCGLSQDRTVWERIGWDDAQMARSLIPT